MKKLFVIIATLCLIASCNSAPEKKSMEQLENEINQHLTELLEDESLSDEQKSEQYYEYLQDLYSQHLNDTLDLELFGDLMVDCWTVEETKAQFESASDLIKNDGSIQKRYNLVLNQVNTEKGKPFIDIVGVDAVTGEPVSLSQIIKTDKPTLLDFWASWCSPCRNEINKNLKDLAATDKVNIIGIAVWEEGIEDTQKAMEELSITWPVIFNGGRDESITEQYGVYGIPTLFLIDTDGKFIESAHSIEDMEFFK